MLSRWLAGGLITALALAFGINAVFASHTIDLTSPGATTIINGALFQQADFTDSSLGTGVVDSFLRVQASPVEHGFNTDAPAPFDAKAGNFTKSMLLSNIPTVERDGVLYREIWLDINEPANYPTGYLSLDTYELWTSANPALVEGQYDLLGGTGFGSDADLKYTIGDASMILDYNLASGSGQSGDLVQYIPDAYFDVAGCEYGSSTCMTYFYLFSTFGANEHADTFDDVAAQAAGFEEFFVIARPVVTVEKTAVVDSTITYDWDIEKTVAPASHTGFIGDEFSSNYDVTVTRDDGTVSAQVVSGDITITNTGDSDATIIAVTDILDGYVGDIAVECGVSFPHTLNVGDVLVCTYSQDAADQVIGDTNTARVELQEVLGSSPVYSDTVGVVFNPATEVNATVDVFDDFLDDGVDIAQIGDDISVTTTIGYSQSFACGEDNSSTTGTTTNYPNRASTDLGDEATANVSLTCYVPTVTKTANGSYDEDHLWTIDKSVDPESQSAFAGETVTYEWEIVVTEEVVFNDFDVSGTITVGNPNPVSALVVDLTDVLSDATTPTITADADCDLVDGQLTVPVGGTSTCDYSASLAIDDPADRPDTNTATIGFNGQEYSDTVDVNWTVDVTDDTVNLIDPLLDINDELTDGTTITRVIEYTCSTDSTDYDIDGFYSFSETNEAKLVLDDASELPADATTEVDCYQPSISKTADGTYDLVRDWEVIKTVVPGQQDAFAGETVNFTWTIEVNELASTENNHDVAGTVTVVNPNPESALVVTVTDELSDGTIISLISSATCDLDLAGALAVAPGSTANCDYSADDVGSQVASNTAQFTLNGVTYPATDGIDWVQTEINEDPVINDDDFLTLPALVDVTVDDSYSADFIDAYTCESADSGRYVNGTYGESITNDVVLSTTDGFIDSDSATTVVDCYTPTSVGDQAATYDLLHEWTVDKTVTPLDQTGGPGDVLSWTWTVVADETETMFGWETTGSLTITNTNPTDDYPFTVAELLAATGVLFVEEDDVTCPSLTAPAGGQVTCTFTEVLTADEFAVLGGSVDEHVGPQQVLLTDDQIGLSKTIDGDYTTVGDGTIDPTGSHTCSSDWSAYDPDGTYTETVVNIAQLTDNTELVAEDDATTMYTCDAGRITVLKLSNGVVDPSQDWAFTLYTGPDGFNIGEEVGTASTLGNVEGLLVFTDEFGVQPALTIGDTYTVCEENVRVGWQPAWSDANGVPVVPYNPDAATGENLGNFCVEVVIVERGTVSFTVDNRRDGDQRTPGYWKNWSTCSGGNQAQTAADKGGFAEDYWLIDDVLMFGGVVLNPDMLTGDNSFVITYCEDAVAILSHQDLDGVNRASDPAYKLARNLLAAKANLVAGASSCAEVGDAIIAAEALLDEIEFDGYGEYLKRVRGPERELKQQASALATLLDEYNNGRVC